MSLTVGGAPLSIAQGVREFGRAAPQQVAVIDGPRRWTYAQLVERSRRWANVLLGLDLEQGDRVAVFERFDHSALGSARAYRRIHR